MQAHLHGALAATENPDAAWQWVRFLSTPFYQLQFCRTGLWLPSQTALASDEGLQEWITDGVHPADYSKMVTSICPASAPPSTCLRVASGQLHSGAGAGCGVDWRHDG
ncbi:MAG: hypothetical protein R2851_01670 [Caldilineaceae bacterium]